MIRDRANLTRQAYLFAAYRHYLKYKTDDNGTKFEIAEPLLTATDDILIASNSPIDFLSLSPFQSTELKAADEFVELVIPDWYPSQHCAEEASHRNLSRSS